MATELTKVTFPTGDYITRNESSLTWGGANLTGSYGCIDAALMDELGANRFQFIKASAITVEYSRDNGETWTDYGATDTQKQQIFAQGGSLVIGKADSTHKATEHPGQYQLRITIDTGVAGVYSYLNKFVIYVSTNNSGNCSCKIQKALQSTPTAFVDHTDWIPVTGWSGYNVLNTSYLPTYGNTPSGQYGRVRFIFKDSISTGTSYNGLTVLQIKAFGGVGWITPSTMAKTGHLYSYKENQSAVFPNEVYATAFYENNVALSSKYFALSGGTITGVPKFGSGSISAFSGNIPYILGIEAFADGGAVKWKSSSDVTVGSATTASKLGSSNVGSATQPIYLNGGTATACTYTLGKSVPSDAVFTDHYAWTDITGKPSTFTPSTHYHYELKTIGDQRTISTTPNDYVDKLIFRGLKNASAIGSPGGGSGYSYLVGLRGWGDSSGGDAHELAFNNNGIYCRHGATTTWGDWSKIFTSADTYTGPLTSSQVTTALGFTPTANTGTITSVKTTAGTHTTINVSSGAANFNVPTKTSHLTNDSGYVTTDTKNTAGSTDTSSKIFLIGATSQAANPQTYSDNEVYTTSGVLTTKSVQVGGGSCTMKYNSTTQSLDFVFA